MQILHQEHEGENATWETETWMEEQEQIDFKESEVCGPELFVSGQCPAACSFEYRHEL